MDARGRDRAVLGGVLLVAAVHYGVSLATHRPFVAYDAEGHMHYVATLVDLGRLPHPFEGWSTFHPPLYYLLLAAIAWPWAPLWPAPWLEGVSALATLATGALAFRALRRLGHDRPTSALATGLLLFLPCTQLSATMVGNEAMGAMFASGAALAGLRLDAEPRRALRSAATGLLVGLAVATKFTGILALPALVVPYLRRGVDARLVRAALAGLAALLAVGVWPYARSWSATGEWLPMTRDREPVATIERSLTLRERRASDYLWLDPAVFRQPVIHQGVERAGALNPVMTNVWGLFYASAWYDAHELRVPQSRRAAGLRAGRGLLLLGVLPTALLIAGAVLSLRRSLRGRDPAAPLLGMAVLGGLAFVAFTLRAPAVAAVKASYLLPLAVPASVFFARGLAALPRPARRFAFGASAAAAVLAAVVFAAGVLLPLHADGARAAPPWMTPDLARAAADLDRASAGRWIGIRAEPAFGHGIAWRLLARSYPPLSDEELAVWCREIRERMLERAPSRPWRATIVQGSRSWSCEGSAPR